MEEYYLICIKCNGYYKLEEWESPEDFVSCNCGGDLVLVNDIYEYIDEYDENDYEYYYEETKGKRISKKMILLFLFFILIPIAFIINFTDLNFLFPDNSVIQGHPILGSDKRGYVTKQVYPTSNAFNSKSKTIAIITGIHPREKLSKTVISDLIKKYPLYSTYKIVHYDIKVTNNPENYKIGRNNGENLAADYILPDVLKSDDDLVIICHDHEPGYGEGFYIATPGMDEGSVKLAETVKKSLLGFNYYKADSTNEHTTSAMRVSKPLSSAGYKTFVYEIPEWITYTEAYGNSYSLIEKCFTFIN
ncbi:MAG: hypothetical protein HZC47_07735 [Methanobacterium sp.]|uniref:hypothetical protein n=1 Tax=Methanobacterium sp. TaxID=2164 RepID=UPI003D659D1A|nr:hypothetical protein [Methanobacterium sp.]